MWVRGGTHCAILFLIIVVSSFNVATSQRCDPPCKARHPFFCNNTAVFNAARFPKGFLFGAASSAYQFEGAEGRGLNIWDSYTHRYPSRTPDRSNGDIAINSYKYFKEDVALLKGMGAKAYRFSIAWSRVLPRGRVSKGVSESGVAYYNNLINELKDNEIEPFVTLYHWDLPQFLDDDYLGFLDRKIIDDFKDFAELCFQRFGDRVKNWITFNQPYSVSTKGYGDGTYPPGRCSSWMPIGCEDGGNSSTEPYIVTHNELLAHAKVVELYREKYKKLHNGKIGITLIGRWFFPLNETSQEDRDSVPRAMAFILGWFMDPLFKGHYPEIMRERVGNRLPEFTPDEVRMVNGSFDFIGLNYYVTQYVTPKSGLPSFDTDAGVKYSFKRNGVDIGVEGYGNFSYYPPGFKLLLDYVNKEYNSPDIYITENGLKSNGNLPVAELLADQDRIEFHCSHLSCLQCAIGTRTNIKGYFAWSLADNYEFGDGYSVRFGMNYVDYNNPQDRRPKSSAAWFKRFIETRP